MRLNIENIGVEDVKFLIEFYEGTKNPINEIIVNVDGAPLTFKRIKKGYWTDKESFENGHYSHYQLRFVCSCCNKAASWESSYCPNCGAKMEVEE